MSEWCYKNELSLLFTYGQTTALKLNTPSWVHKIILKHNYFHSKRMSNKNYTKYLPIVQKPSMQAEQIREVLTWCFFKYFTKIIMKRWYLFGGDGSISTQQAKLKLFAYLFIMVKNLPAMRETWVRPLGWEDPLEKGKVTHSGIQYSGLENYMDRIVHGVAKSRARLSDFH